MLSIDAVTLHPVTPQHLKIASLSLQLFVRPLEHAVSRGARRAFAFAGCLYCPSARDMCKGRTLNATCVRDVPGCRRPFWRVRMLAGRSPWSQSVRRASVECPNFFSNHLFQIVFVYILGIKRLHVFFIYSHIHSHTYRV